MTGSADDFLRQMIKGNLKLVSYHRGTKKLDHAELQTMDVSALNTRSSGFKGPSIVPLDVFNQLVQAKLIAETSGQSEPNVTANAATRAKRRLGKRFMARMLSQQAFRGSHSIRSSR